MDTEGFVVVMFIVAQIGVIVFLGGLIVLVLWSINTYGPGTNGQPEAS